MLQVPLRVNFSISVRRAAWAPVDFHLGSLRFKGNVTMPRPHIIGISSRDRCGSVTANLVGEDDDDDDGVREVAGIASFGSSVPSANKL